VIIDGFALCVKIFIKIKLFKMYTRMKAQAVTITPSQSGGSSSNLGDDRKKLKAVNLAGFGPDSHVSTRK